MVNAAGSPVDPATGLLWSDRHGTLDVPDTVGRVALSAARGQAARPFNTTIGAVLTDLTLTKAQAGKVAAVAHDGLARAVRPAHGMTDGDTFFALASSRLPAPDESLAAVGLLNRLLEVTADVVVDACFAALTAAETRGRLRSYRELGRDVVPRGPIERRVSALAGRIDQPQVPQTERDPLCRARSARPPARQLSGGERLGGQLTAEQRQDIRRPPDLVRPQDGNQLTYAGIAPTASRPHRRGAPDMILLAGQHFDDEVRVPDQRGKRDQDIEHRRRRARLR